MSGEEIDNKKEIYITVIFQLKAIQIWLWLYHYVHIHINKYTEDVLIIGITQDWVPRIGRMAR